MTPIQKIRFEGKEWVLVGGAITTPEAYRNFAPSYAHLFDDGRIVRWGKQIGARADIEFLGDADPMDVADEAVAAAITTMLSGVSPWEGKK